MYVYIYIYIHAKTFQTKILRVRIVKMPHQDTKTLDGALKTATLYV